LRASEGAEDIMKRTADLKFSSFLAGGIPVRLHLRSDLHLARKAFHMGMGLLIAAVYLLSGISTSTAVTILASFLGLDLLLETARLRIPSFNERVMRTMGPLMRTCEVDRMSGVPHYLLATLLAVAIFPKPVAVLSILYLACGDPVASLFGILYGKHSIRLASGKSLVGTLAGVVTCAVVTAVFLMSLALPEPMVFALTIIGGLAGGLAELVPFEMDDNFTIPVISGFALWIAFIAMGI
jgi:diacylglycerol kinase (CTP)